MISLHNKADRIAALQNQLDAAGCVCRTTNHGCTLTIFSGLPAMTREEALAVVGLSACDQDDGAANAPLERNGG